MSTTDKPTWQLAEQICEVPAVDEAIRTFVEDNTSDNAIGLVLAVLDYQAATEAAKATGTALYGCGFGCKCTATFQHGECNADHSELSFKVKNPICQKCKGTGEQDSGGVYPWGEGINVPCDCEAARQPAPVTIKTWQERQVSEGGMQNPGYKMWGERFYMVEEIADLRAALAATAAPVLSDERDNEIFELQKALAFWLPQINEFMSGEMSKRIAHDAYMLVIDGNLPDDFKTAQELGWILPATGKVQEGSEMVCGNCMEPIAATRSQP